MPRIDGRPDVTRPARAPMTDLAAARTVARELYGPTATIVDGGVVGVLDPKDKLVRQNARGEQVTRALGVRRSENIAFRAHVVQAAKDLAASGASFSGSHETDKVNQDLWTMGYGGKMQVRKWLADGEIGKPSTALRDIFANGKAYGFECATAMMVIYHKAILDHVGDEAFDKLFSEPRNLAFFRWDIEDSDYVDAKKLVHRPMPLAPGTHYYFENPDAAPENSAFRGENVIYLGEGQFYAHGIVGDSGTYLVTEKDIVDTLSALRAAGADTPPRRVNMAMWLDGYALSKKVFPDGPPELPRAPGAQS
jgi:protein-glutamine gamma-glutamyltransferase